MSFLFFWLAAALSAVWLCVHLVAGGRQILRPLRAAAGLAPIVRDTQYLCWHFTSLAIACMAGFFTAAAILGEPAYGVAGTTLAAGFFFVGVGLVVGMRARHATLPQGWLFLPVALLGTAGLAW